MSKCLEKRLAVLESSGNTNTEAQRRSSETLAYLKDYDEVLVEFRKLPLDEQNRLNKIENAEIIKWYVSGVWKE